MEELKMENVELKDKFIDEKTRIEYIRKGDYYYPNLYIPKARRKGNIEKYGLMRLNYIRNHKGAFYTDLLLENELKSHLLDIDDECKERLNTLIKQMKKEEMVTEKLKEINQMEWVCRMNNIKNRAEEIILNEIIYR